MSAVRALALGAIVMMIASINEATAARGRSKKRSNTDPLTRALAPRERYCAVSSNHTACLYNDIDMKTCREVKTRGLTPPMIATIVDAHNEWRRDIARGNFGNPTAANMARLTWDEEAASIAQRFVDQCKFGNDKRRDTVKTEWRRNGQNIYLLWNPSNVTSEEPKNTVLSWIAEMKQMIAKNARNTSLIYQDDPPKRQYTQIAWAKTSNIGCGFIQFMNDTTSKMLYSFLVCNYGPTGNWVGDPIYREGKPCAACPGDLPRCVEDLCTKKSGKASRAKQAAKAAKKKVTGENKKKEKRKSRDVNEKAREFAGQDQRGVGQGSGGVGGANQQRQQSDIWAQGPNGTQVFTGKTAGQGPGSGAPAGSPAKP